MTISSETRKAGPFDGNDVTTSFPFSFKVFAESDLQVVLTDTDDVNSTLTLDSDYSVTLNGDQDASPGGTITYPISGDPLATGEMLTVIGDTGYTQETDIVNQSGFYPRVVENAFDKLTMLIQQLAEKINRAPLLSVATTLAALTLPAPGAAQYLRWNVAGTDLEAVSSTVSSGTFLQSGADAVTREANAKMGETVSIQDFGNGGTADDSALVQKAVNAAYILGATLLVNDGVTFTVENIDLKCSLKGNGTLKLKNSATNPLLVLNSGKISIVGVKFDGNASNQALPLPGGSTDGLFAWGVGACISNFINVYDQTYTCNAVDSLRVEGCTFSNLFFSAITHCGSSKALKILNNTFDTSKTNSIYITGNPTTAASALFEVNTTIAGNEFLDIGGTVSGGPGTGWGDTVVIGNVKRVKIYGNFFKNCKRDALYFGSVEDVTVVFNTFDAVQWNAIQLHPDDYGVTNKQFRGDFIAYGNTCTGLVNADSVFCTLTGSSVNKTFIYDNVIIANNTCQNPTGANTIGIQVLSHQYRSVLIQGNDITGAYQGIQVNTGASDLGPAHVTILGNSLFGIGANAIQLTGTNFVTASKRARIFIKQNTIVDGACIGIRSEANITRQLEISGNYIHGNTQEGIYLGSSGAYGPDFGIIKNNISNNQIFSDLLSMRYTYDNISLGSSVTITGTPIGTGVRTGTATPAGSVTPAFIGESYIDTSGGKVYVSKGLTNADWLVLN